MFLAGPFQPQGRSEYLLSRRSRRSRAHQIFSTLWSSKPPEANHHSVVPEKEKAQEFRVAFTRKQVLANGYCGQGTADCGSAVYPVAACSVIASEVSHFKKQPRNMGFRLRGE